MRNLESHSETSSVPDVSSDTNSDSDASDSDIEGQGNKREGNSLQGYFLQQYWINTMIKILKTKPEIPKSSKYDHGFVLQQFEIYFFFKYCTL